MGQGYLMSHTLKLKGRKNNKKTDLISFLLVSKPIISFYFIIAGLIITVIIFGSIIYRTLG